MKLEKKQIDLDTFLNALDFNNIQKDNILFSDLDDDDEEPFERKQSEAGLRKDSERSLNESEASLPKISKASRKKSVMSYAL